jgi:hypothetical protein
VSAAGQLTAWHSVSEFVFGGSATFTLRSLKTGERITYRVKAKKADLAAGERDPAYFVTWLRGPDNTKDFAYLGVLRKPHRFFITSRSQATRQSLTYKSFVWFLQRLADQRTGILGETFEFWHEGRCACCSRKLTVPESIASGFGPSCASRRAA